jgi:hypothetical protein
MALKINRRTVCVLYACLLSFVAAGCATNSYSSAGAWEQPRTRDAPFESVLVVAIMPDANARYLFEQAVAEAITEGEATGISAHSVSRQRSPDLTRDIVVAMANSSGADSVLLTRILDRATQTGLSQEEAIVHLGRTTKVVQSEDSSFTRALTTNYAVEVVPGSFAVEANAVLESSLYELDSEERLVYRAITQGHFEIGAAYEFEEAVYRMALSVGDQLRSDRVIN